MTDLEVAVQLLGGDTNKVIYDDIGIPSIMVRFDKGKISDVITGGSENTHPAFSVDGAEIPRFWYSKYQNTVIKGQDGIVRAYSLPLQDPKVNITFDQAQLYCINKGAGWHLSTNAEWAWIALKCRKDGFMPRGNNYSGKNFLMRYENGIGTFYTGPEQIGRVATGSGPKSWSHNNDASGVWDLNGNVWEWIGGYRVVDGEIQIIPYNNAANRENPQTIHSTLWKAIMPNGSLVDPGTAGTLKWDYVSGKIVLSTDPQNVSAMEMLFGAIDTTNGIVCPEIMKSLALFPFDDNVNGYGGTFVLYNGEGEWLAFRGGNWGGGPIAGVYSMNAKYPRLYFDTDVGFRSAFVEL